MPEMLPAGYGRGAARPSIGRIRRNFGAKDFVGDRARRGAWGSRGGARRGGGRRCARPSMRREGALERAGERGGGEVGRYEERRRVGRIGVGLEVVDPRTEAGEAEAEIA